VAPEAVRALPQITPSLRQIFRTIRRTANVPADPFYFLRASDDPDARAVLEARRKVTKPQARQLPIESFCAAANVSPLKILSIIVGIASTLNVEAESLITAVNRPRMVQKTIDRAMDDEREDAAQHMEMFHKHTGFIPGSRGITITQNNSGGNAVAQAAARVVDAPPPDQIIRRLNDRFNERPAAPLLPPTTPDPLTTHEQGRFAPVEDAGDSDDDE
jgi:hypothetical protein